MDDYGWDLGEQQQAFLISCRIGLFLPGLLPTGQVELGTWEMPPNMAVAPRREWFSI